MGVEIIYDQQKEIGVLYCNTSDYPVGMVLYSPNRQILDDFLSWFFEKYCDPRQYEGDIQEKYKEFLKDKEPWLCKELWG